MKLVRSLRMLGLASVGIMFSQFSLGQVTTSTSLGFNCALPWCAQAQALANVSLSSNAQTALELVEELYPELFANGSAFFDFKGYTASFYADSGIAVGFKDGRVFVVGGPYGTSIQDVGTEASVVVKLQDAKISIGNPSDPNTPVPCNEAVTGQLGCGEWDIRITGTVSQTIFGMTTTLDLDNLLLEDVPMNNPTSKQEIEDLLNDSYKDIGTISNLVVDIVTNTDNHIVLDLAFNASLTSQGVTVNQVYDLRYDMTR